MSVAVYEDGLRRDTTVLVRYRDGSAVPLDVERWHGPARGADDSLLRRVDGAALDVGCGPGRLVAALTARGLPALGIDIAPAAVGLTRQAGGRALQLSVFDVIPDAGRWSYAVLADGNIGIGGDPVALLRRIAALLAPGGDALVELDPPGRGLRHDHVRLHPNPAGTWFTWAWVGADAIAEVAARAGFRVTWTTSRGHRWFARLERS
jgi:SAM-dependent methyltransferase